MKKRDDVTPTRSSLSGPSVLFIGNSLTFWKPGLNAIFRLWFGAAAAVTEGGATLKVLWDAGKALDAIRSRQYDVVVLQDDLPEYGRSAAAASFPDFSKYVRLFVESTRENGSTPVLLLTHSYERLRHTSRDGIARAHQEASNALGVAVAPSGLVLGYEGLSAGTKLGPLLSRDKEHQLPAGMLLAALIVRVAIADAFDDNEGSTTEELEALALRAIEGGMLAGGAALSPPAVLAAQLAANAQAGKQWWRIFPARPPEMRPGAIR